MFISFLREWLKVFRMVSVYFVPKRGVILFLNTNIFLYCDGDNIFRVQQCKHYYMQELTII